jgi:cytochrome c oxidase subunit 2
MRRRRRRRQLPLAAAIIACAALPAQAAAPMSYLTSHGARGLMILPLTWGVLAIAIAVALVFVVLAFAGIWRRGVSAPDAIAAPPHRRDASLWLYVGVPISLLLLLVAMVWTVVVLHRIAGMPPQTALTIEVTGRQWWWQVRYLDADPSRVVSTANEIHVPVGQPVRVKLVSADVIHSFWVPALGGKTDAIPGQTNFVWLQADEPGRYRGQCSEYCGVQHAHMALEVVAEAPDAFKRWYAAQLEPAAATMLAGSAAHGAQTFEYRCGVCHTVRGTRAGGTSGPDLTHLMARGSIAALTVPNSAGTLAAWMANPQAIKPGNRMPVLQLSPQELSQLDAFLVTLK